MGKQSFIIGRAGHITLYDDTVSRRHACLDVEDGALYLRDLKSRNGTYEIRDKALIPFSGGQVYSDQVFAFGECVRSVTQLLKEAGVSLASQASPPTPSVTATDNSADSERTQIGFRVPAQQRLTRANIVVMLEQIEDHVLAGGDLDLICGQLAITMERYERWCDEYGQTRDEREKSIAELRRENARLRSLVADLAGKNHALEQYLKRSGLSLDAVDPDDVEPGPNFTIVGGDTKS